MPRVVELMAEYRAGEGDHLDQCWKRGVIGGEAGWFFAVEGPVTLGVPFDLDECQEALRAFGFVLRLAPLPDGSECRRLNRAEAQGRAITEWGRREEAQRERLAAARWGVVVARLERGVDGAD